jgi:hypothetical protein
VHAFRGSLQLQDHTIATSGPQTQDGERLDRLPAIELDFISHGEYLVPIDRDRQFDSGNGSYWGMILGPGRVWSEPDDGD